MFLHCKTLDYGTSGHWSICHMPSPPTIFITSNPPWESINNIFFELHACQWTWRLSTLLGWFGGDCHTHTRKIDIVRVMKTIICPWRTISTMLCHTSKVRNLCHEQRPRGIICNSYYKLGKISNNTWAFFKNNSFMLGPTMAKWMPFQVMSI